LNREEAVVQELVCRDLDRMGILYIASLVGVNLNARVGAMRKRMGVRAGVHDLIILEPNKKYHGMTLELKVKGGKVSQEQLEFQLAAQRRGYY